MEREFRKETVETVAVAVFRNPEVGGGIVELFETKMGRSVTVEVGTA